MNCFEHLSNELLLDIFEFINPRHLFYHFWNINSRLNNLLLSIKHLRLVIDETESHELISALAPHAGLLTVNTWDDIDLHKFRNLYSLKLARPTQIQLKQIRADTMPNLTYLLLSPNVYFSAPKQLISDAFTGEFRHLRWARLGHIDSYDPLCHFKSLSLRYLHIGCYHTTIIPCVLATCPNLQQLSVDCLRSGDKTMYSPATIDNHPLQQFILQDFCRSVSYEDIITLITYIPNASKIKLKFDCESSVISLMQYLANHLSDLKRFDCYITECPIDSASLVAIQQIHPCFSYVTCHTIGEKFRIFDTQTK
ncbi:unnamed protein product [Rotaria socialis]